VGCRFESCWDRHYRKSLQQFQSLESALVVDFKVVSHSKVPSLDRGSGRVAKLEVRMAKIGVCHLCGQNGKLSFEHVPPEAAFNDQRVLESDIHKLIGSVDLVKDLESPKGRFNQRGAGRHTLCESCNNNTGDWYARSYVQFVRQLYPLCHAVSAGTAVTVECTIRPLDVFKQMLVMFCSASPPTFAQKHPRLIRFLLNRESRDADDQQLFLALYDFKNSFGLRQAGLTGRIDGHGASHLFAEISFPPLNIVMSASGGSPDPKLFEVTWFKQFAHRQEARVRLTLNSLAVTTYFPADYRTIDELKAHVQSSDRLTHESQQL
jgi:hypothetical protein